MGDDWKKEYCQVLAYDYKMLGDYKLGSAYCQICGGGYDNENLCNGSYPKCASQQGPVDPSTCMMIPRNNSDGDMRIVPKACDGRSVENCLIDGDHCQVANQDGKMICTTNTKKLIEDPTQQTQNIQYPDYNATCVSRNGEVLPYYDKNGEVSRECTFVTDLQSNSVRLIPEDGYKRTSMKDCVPLSPSNPTGTTHYTNSDFKHGSYKWNPQIADGKPFCNEVTKKPMKLSGKENIKNPFLPVQYYEDNDKGKFYIREPFHGHSHIKKATQHQGIYWNPQKNEAFIA